MAITSIKRDMNNNVSIVRVISSDSLATVSAANYIKSQQVNINNLNDGTFAWFPSDMILVAASDGNALFTFTDSTFSSFIQYGSSGGAGITNITADSGSVTGATVSLSGGTTGLATSGSGTALTLTGTLVVKNGGTGNTTFTAYSLITAGTTATGAFQNVVGLGAAGEVLTSNGVAALPSWQAVTGGVTSTQVQQQAFNVGIDTGAADAYVVNLTPAATLTDGLLVAFTPVNANATTSPVITVNTNPNITISTLNNQPLIAQDFQTGVLAILQYSTATGGFLFLNPQVSSVTLQTVFYNQNTAANDGGVANAYVGAYPVPAAGEALGVALWITNILNANTGASTFDDGTGALPIYNLQLTALVGGELLVNGNYLLSYTNAGALNGWILLNSSLSGGGGVTSTQVQQSAFNFGLDTGIADAYQVNLSPTVSALTDGLLIGVKFNNANATQSPTLQIDATGAQSIILEGGNSPAPNDIDGFNTSFLQYSLATNAFTLLNPNASTPFIYNIQASQYTVANDTGAVNAYVLNVAPTLIFRNSGMIVTSKTIANDNTGASTLDDGLGAIAIVDIALNPLVGGEILAGHTYNFQYNAISNVYVLQNSSLVSAGVTSTQVQHSAFNIAADSGIVNAYVGAYSPIVSALVDGMILTLSVTAGNTNTGASTFDAGTGAFPVLSLLNGSALVGGEIEGFFNSNFQWNGSISSWELLNPHVKSATYTKVILGPASGDTIALIAANNITVLDPSGTLATLTLTMPATPLDGTTMSISSTQIITSLTVNASGGDSIIGQPTSLAVGQAFTMIYDSTSSIWYPA